ncbi:hypothetical protein Ancab_021589 [Ancistrocladus abbreviatus]
MDVMVVNPPYVPTPEHEVGCAGITSPWAGGENGRSITDMILPIGDNLLSDGGWLYMVTLTANNPSQIFAQMRDRGYAARIILQRSTGEDSLHVVKFWPDSQTEIVTQKVATNKAISTKVAESVLSQISRFPFWSVDNNVNE